MADLRSIIDHNSAIGGWLACGSQACGWLAG
jgi:hypothetical protein